MLESSLRGHPALDGWRPRRTREGENGPAVSWPSQRALPCSFLALPFRDAAGSRHPPAHPPPASQTNVQVTESPSRHRAQASAGPTFSIRDPPLKRAPLPHALALFHSLFPSLTHSPHPAALGFIRVDNGNFVDEDCREFYVAGYNTWQVRSGGGERERDGERKPSSIGARQGGKNSSLTHVPSASPSPSQQLLEAAAGVKGTPQEVKEQVSYEKREREKRMRAPGGTALLSLNPRALTHPPLLSPPCLPSS